MVNLGRDMTESDGEAYYYFFLLAFAVVSGHPYDPFRARLALDRVRGDIEDQQEG